MQANRLIIARALALVLVLAAIGVGGAYAGESDDDSGRAEALAQMTAPLPATRVLSMAAALKLHDRTGLEELLREQQDPLSANYRGWLTPAEFNQRFGPSQAEIDRVAGWLTSEGFIIDSPSPSPRLIRFHGPAGTASIAFGVKFAASSDGHLFANLNEPRLPEVIAPLVDWIGGLDNLKAKIVLAHLLTAKAAVEIGTSNIFGPPDIYSFYDETPLLTATPAPIDGSNTDCVALAEDSDFDHASTDAFNTQFGLPAFDYSLEADTNFETAYPDSSDPGIPAGEDELESLIDIDYVHALAPGADIADYVGDNSHATITGLGFLDAALAAISQNRCGTISISYDICSGNSSFFRKIDSFFAQGAAQGQSIFIAAGDEGAAAFTFEAKQDACVAGKKRGVEGLESSPHVTSIGGTMFTPDYDSSGGNIGDVPESVWNDTSGASGGGKSNIFGKPKYQKGLTPRDSSRDVPDISFGAGLTSPGFYIISLDNELSCNECIAGGTSIGAPSWAGISMLIQQELDTRPGLINSALYQLGPSGAKAGIRDVTSGNNSYNGVKGYAAVPGYDQASGWGTPDIADFVSAFIAK
ncbi:MAG TPA: S53 family peptidase [Candidatus Binataceae bacterium]|nr:S53 family peptidase [Candidatus Binataceae bacterium]